MNKKETLLDVAGMSCPSCVRHVNEALAEIDGVIGIDVRLRDGKVLVRHDPEIASVSTLLDALRSAGYEPTLSVAA